jgi:hypothetical protein
MSARAKHKELKLTPEMREMLRRRTMPFLDSVGLDKPVSFLLQETYLQGMRDIIQAMEEMELI